MGSRALSCIQKVGQNSYIIRTVPARSALCELMLSAVSDGLQQAVISRPLGCLSGTKAWLLVLLCSVRQSSQLLAVNNPVSCRFGKPLTFKRDLQLQHVDVDNVPDKSNQRNSVHPAGRQCSSAKQDSTHRRRPLLADGPAPQQQHLAGSPANRLEQPQTLQHSRQQACLRKACAGQVLPLGLLAASFVRQGVSTAAAAEAVAAAAAVAHAAAQMPAPPPAPPAAQSRSAACSSDGASAVPKQRESSAEADAGAGCTLAVAGDAAGESAKATAGAALSKTAQARVRAMPVAAIWLQLPVTASLHDLQDRRIRTSAVAHPGLQAISVSVAVALLILPSE